MRVQVSQRWLLPSGLLVWMLLSPNANAQSFLDKLEEAVRNQLSQPSQPAEQEAEELPPPNRDGGLRRESASNVEAAGAAEKSSVGTLSMDRRGGGRSYLGLEAEQTVDGRIGVRVLGITRQSPAWKAGFKVDDRILALNGFAISDLQGLAGELAKTKPGETARFLIARGGRNRELTAVLVDAELAASLSPSPALARSAASGEAGRGSSSPESRSGRPYLGLRVNDLTSAFRQQFGITVFRGAAVSNVAPGSPAARAGIRAGDAVVEADSTPIQSADDLLRWVSSTKPGQEVELIVYRGGFAESFDVVLSEDSPTLGSRVAKPSAEPRLAPSIVVNPNAARTDSAASGSLDSNFQDSNALAAQSSVAGDANGDAPDTRVVDPFEPRADSSDPKIVPPPIQIDASAEGTRNTVAKSEATIESLVAEIEKLEIENSELQAVLAETEARLEATEQKLTKILQLLQQNR